MECKWHAGQEAEFTCMKCGQNFCRQCVQETRESHYCPDCHKAEVERFATQLGPREPKVKAKKEKARGPAARKEQKKEKKEEKKKKQLRKPAERPVDVVKKEAVAPPAPPPPPSPSVSPEEKKEFWGGIEQPRRAVRRTREPAEPVHVEGLPPPAVGAGEEEPGPLTVPEGKKRRILSDEARQEAVLVSEGFPSGPGEAEQGEEPATARRGKRAARKARRPSGEERVAMQVPMDYDGEVTASPSYIKALLWALLAGLIGAAAYAALAWWLHSDRGIFGWVIGFAVGVAVALGSGRHFNWQLGIMAAAIAMFFVSAGRIAYFMMDVRFNSVFPMPLPFGTLFNESLEMYYHEFISVWLIFFIIAGVVAFIITFRPPPIRLQIAGGGPPARRPARRGA